MAFASSGSTSRNTDARGIVLAREDAGLEQREVLRDDAVSGGAEERGEVWRDNDAAHAPDQLRFVDDLDDVDLVAGSVLPAVADCQREIGIRFRRVPGIVEEARVDLRVIPALSEDLAGCEARVALVLAPLARLVMVGPCLRATF